MDLDRFFKLKQNGTTVRTEIMAGITTFMTMAYILAVNPDILSAFKSGATGGDWTAIFLATAIAAGVITIAMGLFVNFPVALAPGMGLNAYFATIILTSQGNLLLDGPDRRIYFRNPFHHPDGHESPSNASCRCS